MDLDEVRLKEPEELTDDEKTLLRDHQAELSDEEKDAFKSIIEVKKEPEEEKDEPFKTFKTQEELDAFLEEHKTKDGPEEEESEDKEEDKPTKFFPDDYKPKDWNQFANDLLPKLRPEMRRETEAYSQETRDKIADINAQFDREIEQLRVIDSSIPAPGTPERAEFDKSLAKVALENKDVRTMTQAYSIYKQGAGEEGGDKKKEEPGDDLARKIGGGGKSGGASKDKKYSEVAGISEEQAWDAALRDLEASS